MRCLDLSWNDIGELGGHSIAQLIKKNELQGIYYFNSNTLNF